MMWEQPPRLFWHDDPVIRAQYEADYLVRHAVYCREMGVVAYILMAATFVPLALLAALMVSG